MRTLTQLDPDNLLRGDFKQEDYNVSLVEYELVPLSLASSSAPTSAPAEQPPAPVAAT